MLQEAAHAKRLAFVEGVAARVALQFAEEVLSEDVEGLALGRLENRLDEPDARLFGAPFCGQGAEPGLVAGLLASVVVHRQSGRLVHRADVGFTCRRQEAVVVSAVDAEGLQFPGAVPVGVPRQVALAVEVGGGVFPTLVQGGQDVAVVAVAKAHIHAHGAQHVVVLKLGAKRAGGRPGLRFGGLR